MRAIGRIPHWAWIAGLAALLRIPTLGREALWYDETFTAWVSQLQGANFWQAIRGDVHPPLWYLIEWLVARLFGTSEFALRLPSALFSIGACLMLWRVALSLGFNRVTAFIAGILCAVLPSSLYYGQEARMYAMLSLFVLIAVQAAIRRKWAWFVAACTGALYSQNLAIFYVAALCAIVLWQERHRPVKALAAALAIGAIWSPWAFVVLEQIQAIGQGFWLHPITVGGALEPLMTMTMGWRLPERFVLHAYSAAVIATLVGLIASRRWLRSRHGAIILVTALGAPVLAAIVSVAWRSVYLPRAFLPSALLLMLFWAYALTAMLPFRRKVLAALLVPMLAVGTLSHYLNNPRFNWREWLTPVREQWQEGDVIFHPALSSAITIQYYLQDKPYILRRYATDLNQSLSPETRVAFGFNEGTLRDAAQHKRVWLLFSTNPMSSRQEIDLFEWARETAQTVRYRQAINLVRMGIFLWEPSPRS